MSRRIAYPGMMEWWQENRADYSPEMVEWIEKVTETVRDQKRKAVS